VTIVSDVAVTIIGLCITTAIVCLTVGISHRSLAATVSGQMGSLQGTISIIGNGGAKVGGGAVQNIGPLVWQPIWRQTGGVLPDGSVDPQQYNDCGETNVAATVRAIRGVPKEPGEYRQQLGGPSRSGLTTADDLVRLLALNNVSAHAISTDALHAWNLCVSAWSNRNPVYALGSWLSPASLHWLSLRDKRPEFLVFGDPWTGTEVSIAHDRWTAQYAEWLVVVDDVCHYNAIGEATPGTGAQA